MSPEPQEHANTSAGGIAECRRPPRQAWNTHGSKLRSGQRKTYQMTQQVTKASFHTDLPGQDCWAYEGKLPGLTIHAYYGEPCIVRVVNKLPDIGQHRGYGCPETSMHLHNEHTPSESDGNPDDYFARQAELNPSERDTGRYRDHHYPNAYAGNDPREALGTLWYHDHRHDFTAPNGYRGITGFYLLFDELGSNIESDRSKTALRLPSGEYDVPLQICDPGKKAQMRDSLRSSAVHKGADELPTG